jgi:MFS family permease
LRKTFRHKPGVIYTVNIGSFLEWYLFFIFLFWTDLVENDYSDLSQPIMDTITLCVVGLSSLFARPFGAWIFASMGDHLGRKKSLTLSILLMIVATLCIFFATSFSQFNILTLLVFGIGKVILSIPAGGELPGAMCILHETKKSDSDREFYTSFTFWGPQLGQIAAIGHYLCLRWWYSGSWQQVQHQVWKWQFIFIFALLGIGAVLRHFLAESHDFEQLLKHHHALPHPTQEMGKNHKGKTFLIFFISIFEVTGFYILTVFPMIYFPGIFNMPQLDVVKWHLVIMSIPIFLTPIIGKISSRLGKDLLFYLSCAGMLTVFYWYHGIASSDFFQTLTAEVILMAFMSIQFALLPGLLTRLAPIPVRFSCIGFGFNGADALIGGLVPVVGSFIVRAEDIPIVYLTMLLASSLLSACLLPKANKIIKSVENSQPKH